MKKRRIKHGEKGQGQEKAKAEAARTAVNQRLVLGALEVRARSLRACTGSEYGRKEFAGPRTELKRKEQER